MDLSLHEHDITQNDTLVYLHIPKTGGTTLKTHLDPMWHPQARFPEELERKIDGLNTEQLAQYKSFMGHFYYSQMESKLGAFTGITVLRDPAKRIVSLYSYIRGPDYVRERPERLPLVERVREMSLEEFVDASPLYQNTRDLQARMLGDALASAQTYRVDAPDPNILACAKARLAALACFGLTERMQDSLLLFCFVFGWRALVDQLRLNPGRKRMNPFAEAPTLQARMSTENALDNELYEYATKLFDARIQSMTLELLERYGQAQHAHLTSPLAAEVIVELLEEHYRARYVARQGNAARGKAFYHLNFGETCEGALNWYAAENHPTSGAFRWSGPNADSWIDLPKIDAEKLVLSLHIIMTATPHSVDGLRVSVNGHEVSIETQEFFQGFIVTARFARTLFQDAPFVRVGIHVKETIVPHHGDNESPETRALGVAVESIELYDESHRENTWRATHRELARYAALGQENRELARWAQSLEKTVIEQQARLGKYERWFAPIAKSSPGKWVKNRLKL